MDARTITLSLVVLLTAHVSFGASARTRNFIVAAPTAAMAEEIAKAAEAYRHDLALEWLGTALPDWPQPCPIVAHVAPNLGAGGRTSFMFQQRTPFGWDMEIQGSRERILDSVLPHEVTHTIFATHFGRPLPRWADEGACTTVEHWSERRKQELWLIRFLKSQRGIPFNHMFAMTEYPGDILPLYSQGYSLARFLIAQGGKPKFVEFVGQGMDTGDWALAVQSFYGFRSVGDLQVEWLAWVVEGSDESRAGPRRMEEGPSDPQWANRRGGAGARGVEVMTAAAEQPVDEHPMAVPRGARPIIDEQIVAIERDPGLRERGGEQIAANGASWYARRETSAPTTAGEDIAPSGDEGWRPARHFKSVNKNLVR